MRYVALIDGKPGAYGVVVPDLPGCTSAAATTDQALRRAVEAVRLWVEDAVADGEKLPKPRSAEAAPRSGSCGSARARRGARVRAAPARHRPPGQGQPVDRPGPA